MPAKSPDLPNIIIATGAGPFSVLHGSRQIAESTKRGDVDGCLAVRSVTSEVPDRSKAILDPDDFTNPKTCAEAMLQGVRESALGISRLYKNVRRLVVVVFCNTFHSPQIFSEFEIGIEELRGTTRSTIDEIKVVNLPRVVVKFLNKELFHCVPDNEKRVGVLCTSGARQSGIYDSLFGEFGWQVENLPPKEQERLHDAIYNQYWGLKKQRDSQLASQVVWDAVTYLLQQDVRAIVLGCTELRFGTKLSVQESSTAAQIICDMFKEGPLPRIAVAGHQPAILLDSSTVGARAAVRASDPNRLAEIGVSDRVFYLDACLKPSSK
ncbi:MAG: aspartate/glutamate racemase family protein [Patescibacteria group bacterium]